MTVSDSLKPLLESAAFHVTTDRVLWVRGEDARTWLNGQITNDIRELSGDRALYAVAATTKGRVVSDLWALAHEDAMAVVLPAAGYDAAYGIFDKHVIMEDVELVAADDLHVVTVQGPRAAEVVQGLSVTRSYAAPRLSPEGVDLWVEPSALESVRAALSQRCAALGGGELDGAAFARAHVALGVPRFGVDFTEASYPQEAGLKERALSFQKGCYRGQEVIYMLENRGQLARRLVLLEPRAPTQAARGTAIEFEGKRVGEVTSHDVTPDTGPATLLMGYVKRPQSEPGQVLDVAGVPCTVRSVVGNTEACPLTHG